MIRSSACLVVFSATSGVLAQASYQQGFDNLGPVNPGEGGPSGLVAQGFIFRNQSQPLGTGTWYGSVGFSHSGTGNLTVTSSVGSGPSPGGLASAWMIFPPIPDQAAGDPLKFFVGNSWSVLGNYAHLEVRYSPSGGISTGSAATTVGDFTTLLADLASPANGQAWTQKSFILPGPGRIAFRYVQSLVSSSTMMGDFQIDTLTVGTPNLGFPIPGPGQTVHWTSAISPVQIGSDIIIPVGGTVVVDPGVVVVVAPTVRVTVQGTLDAREGTRFTVPTNARLNIEGTALFNGTAASRVTLGGGPAWFGGDDGYQVKHTGRAVLSHVDLDALVKSAAYIYLTGGGVVIASDVRVTQPECGFYMDRGTLALRGSTISSGVVRLNESYLLVDDLTLSNAQLISERYRAGQPILLDGITATGQLDDAPFVLRGYDHFFGPSNTISGNLYPVHLTGGGLAPGSTIPLTGNTQNVIHGGEGEIVGRSTFANVGLPYLVDYPGHNNLWLGGHLVIEPGVKVEFAPGAYFWVAYGSRMTAKGLPGSPITFAQAIPGQRWQTVNFTINGSRPVLEHCVFEGGDRALIADETLVRVRDCEFRDNNTGIRAVNWLLAEVRKSRFLNNGLGLQAASNAGFDADGGAMPSLFQGNALAAQNLSLTGSERATGNYWGSPTGPAVSTNPGGAGDPIGPNIDYAPFLSTPPNFADAAPLVRLLPASFLNEHGRRIVLTWTADDDHAIVSHRIEWAPHSECAPGLTVLAGGIPASARSWEVTIPAYGVSSCIDPAVLRVVAVDDAGQEGFDEVMYTLPRDTDPPAPIPFPIGGTRRPGETVDVCVNGASFDATLFLDGDQWSFSLGGTNGSCLSGGMHIPPLSTDLARVGIRLGNAWSFTPYFAIRPDPAIGDAPPTVSMLTPTAGQSFPGGGTVPITWTASDDEAVRSVDLHASYDAGRTWHVIARGLPGSATAFNWQLPPSTGLPDTRVRVVARDLRFQNSSSGGDVAFAILPGGACYPDCTGDGALTVADFGCFQTKFVAADPYADCNADGQLTVSDFGCFQTSFVTGCP